MQKYLRLYLDEVPEKQILVNDVEKQFATLELHCTDKEKEIVKKIEQGDLIDSFSFMDRFGFKLYTSELSTGCKAALCVLNSNDKVINLIECGFNARDVIVSSCNAGAVLINSNTLTFSDKYGDDIHVAVDDYLFTSLDRLNRYIFDERPFNPDMSIKGIQKIEEG